MRTTTWTRSGVEAERSRDRRVGGEPGERVLLLEPREAPNLPSPCAEGVEAALRDHLGDDDPGCGPAPDAVLHARVLVVEGVRRRNPEEARCERELMRCVREGEIERPGAGKAAKRSQSSRHRTGLPQGARSSVGRPDHGVRQAGILEQLERLGKVARGERHLVSALLQEGDERPEEDDVG